MSRSSLLLLPFVVIATIFTFVFVEVPSVQGADLSKFEPGNIIDDHTFYNSSSMTASQIQNFLNSKVPNCDTYGEKRYTGNNYAPDYNKDGIIQRWERGKYRGNPKPYICLKNYKQKTPFVAGVSTLCNEIPAYTSRGAAAIIKDVANACGVSPKVLVVLLQKEQHLVTDDWPWNSQYAKATGFACPDTSPCDPAYKGFFYQVYNAAYQFKRYRANPDNYNYVADQNNNIYWHPSGGNYLNNSGNKVRYDSNNNGRIDSNDSYRSGCGYSNVYIENQATAGLYNYTPYRPNSAALNAGYGTGNSCSAYGNRNFYNFFTDWFGSTHAGYAAESLELKFYSDPARTNEMANLSNVRSGTTVYVRAVFRNTGSYTWSNSFVRLGTENPKNRASIFKNESWNSSGRPTNLSETSVAGGETGTFDFSLTAPTADGEYVEKLRLVAESRAWMSGSGALLTINITVRNPYNAEILSLGPYTNSNYAARRTNGMLQAGDPSYWQLRAKNTGYQTWDNSIVKIGTDESKNRNSIFGNSSWSSWPDNTSRPTNLLESTVAPGEIGTFRFSMTSPIEPGTYLEHFQLVAEGVAWMPAAQFKAKFRVFDKFDRLRQGQEIHNGDTLRSESYRLIMQGDGNLVLYDGGKALWSSRTRTATRLVMQGDGNLVLYDGGKALWSTGTH